MIEPVAGRGRWAPLAVLAVTLRRAPVQEREPSAGGLADFRATWRDPFIRRLAALRRFVPSPPAAESVPA